jgi:glutathione peroxidase
MVRKAFLLGMKNLLLSAMSLLSLSALAAQPIHQIPIKTLDGKEDALKAHKGKALVIVNVASQCGYTGQYAGLQKLQESFAKEGLVVVGVPCNDFGGQEPGAAAEIQACAAGYQASFPLTEKIAIKGPGKHPLYAALTGEASPAAGEVGWNFEKFVVGRDGSVVARFDSGTEPDDAALIEAVKKALAGKP